jgi:CheY-like chemotaxis protein
MNLIVNALKFTNKGTITMSLQYPTIEKKNQFTTMTFTVSDTGIGMDPEELKLLFHRFSQTYSQSKEKSRGFGLGLSICKKMVESMGGTINVESKKGVGSKFQFQITCQASLSKSLPVTPKVALKKTPVFPQNILVVDDNPLNRKVLVTHLTQVGHNCQTASDGQEAIALIARCEFHVILMDIIMPVLDGFKATQQIRLLEKKRNLPPAYIIGISGNAREVYGEQGIACGMNDYLSKPYDKKVLCEKINSATVVRMASAITEATSKTTTKNAERQ